MLPDLSRLRWGVQEARVLGEFLIFQWFVDFASLPTHREMRGWVTCFSPPSEASPAPIRPVGQHGGCVGLSPLYCAQRLDPRNDSPRRRGLQSRSLIQRAHLSLDQPRRLCVPARERRPHLPRFPRAVLGAYRLSRLSGGVQALGLGPFVGGRPGRSATAGGDVITTSPSPGSFSSTASSTSAGISIRAIFATGCCPLAVS